MQARLEKLEIFDHRAIDEVAEIFINQLPEDFCSLMGPGFLRRYFLPYFLNIEPHIGYIAKHGDRVTGFVLGAKASGYYPNFIRTHFMALVIYSLAACLRDIRKLPYFIDVGRVMFGDDAFEPLEQDLELLYISVDKNHQGTGIGAKLVENFLRQGHQLEFTRCVVKTFTASKGPNHFYKKCGFKSQHQHRGRIWYAKPITATKEGFSA